MTQRINLAILGGGINSAAGQAHINAIRMTGKFNIMAGCFSRDPVVNLESAEAYGVEEAWTADSAEKLAEMIAKYGAADRVVILTPTPSHYKDALAMLESRVPVLCEKALAETSMQCNELARQFAKAGIPLSCVFNYAFYPAVARIRNAVVAGQIGTITHAMVEMPQQGYLFAAPQIWRMHDFAIYQDLGVHLHHLLWYMTGQLPKAVTASHSGKLTPAQVTDYVSGLIEYDTFQAHMWFSKASAGHTNGLRIRLYGTEGSIEWFQREPDAFKLNGHVAMEVPNPRFKAGHPTGFVEALANLYEEWAVAPSLEELSPSLASEGLRLMEAMVDSGVLSKQVML